MPLEWKFIICNLHEVQDTILKPSNQHNQELCALVTEWGGGQL